MKEKNKKKIVNLLCRCGEVSEEEIREAIRNGAQDLDAIKRMTRAGMGLCQGKTCGQLIRRILKEMTGQKDEQIKPFTTRAPLRALPIKQVSDPQYLPNAKKED